MNNHELIAALAASTNRTPDEVQFLLNKTVELMCFEWQQGNSIHFQGFGSLEVKKKEERLTVHPSTRARTLIPPKLVLQFKQSSAFKTKLNDSVGHE